MPTQKQLCSQWTTHTQKAECYCCMSSKVYIKTFKDGTNDYWAFQSHLLERTENK